MSRNNKRFRHTVSKKFNIKSGNYGLFRYGKIMDLKYAKGYCYNHNCLLCAHDLKCKSCWKCKYFSENLVDSI